MHDLKQYAHQAIRSLVCPICGALMVGILHEDAWGNRYCSKHTSELHRCSCCQRLISERLTGGGVAYRDNRLVCNLCRKTAIDTKEQAKPYIEAVAAWCYQQGFTFQHLILRVELVYRQALVSSSEDLGNGETQGMIYKSTLTRGGRAPTRQVNGVAILKGLSRQVMEGVAVHELGHAWLFLHGVDGLSAPIEEGFCNLLSYLYHRKFDTDEARFCMRAIDENPDPIYGDGYRAVHAAVQKYTLPVIVDYLRKYRTLPAG